MTAKEQTIIEIPVTDLLERTRKLHGDGYRLVQIGCTGLAESYEINYSFDKEYRFQNLRITVAPGEEVPSISGIYWGAFVYENEMHDLFGIPVTGMNIDFQGAMIRTGEKHPFSVTRKGEGPCRNA
ncbi:NADH-quinone oxidoreductase subunit C [Methanoculleus sp. FWC-SCC1]|uniref:NADH-quinone oxidoreductase subunit C n=1 Tax=Methanoculleus frigidifontis TaxID=2584085 RepID=A0ABT8M9J2_9EURY|nr:NADH-quinone oxidoreductase subunit C [Methanoculleus sp. FWC-SCC1]MDN7024606.1 NADH-quinone oxidoreductase subunit C [Methanoculleus sp. FWC-SCC1]